MKRLFDILASGCGLIVLSPLFLVLAIWIKLDSKGPVFYRQVRVGRGNKDFRIFKFRSMRIGADKGSLVTIGGRDPRVTRSGYYIRKYKFDELPQLINVFVGDMSLVGPRPVIQEELDKYYGETAKLYCTVKPGITGLWQVSGRSDIGYDERVALDATYIKYRSMWGDIVILWKTIGVVLMKKGAY